MDLYIFGIPGYMNVGIMYIMLFGFLFVLFRFKVGNMYNRV